MDSLSSVSPSVVLPPGNPLRHQWRRLGFLPSSYPKHDLRVQSSFSNPMKPCRRRLEVSCKFSGQGEEGEDIERDDEELERALQLDGTIPGTSDEFVKKVSSRAYDMRRHLQQTFDSSSYDDMEFNYQSSCERATQPSSEGTLEHLQVHIANLSRFNNDVEWQSFQNAYCQTEADYEPTCYHPDCYEYPYSWDCNQQQFSDQYFSYQIEVEYHSPLQNEDTSNLEEVLSMTFKHEDERRFENLLFKFIEKNEVRNANQEASLRNQEASLRTLEIQIGRIVNAIMNPPQSNLLPVTDHNEEDG